MEGLANRWKALLQSQSTEELKFSRLAASRKQQEGRPRLKQSQGADPRQLSKNSREKEERIKQQKNKNSRTKSSQQRKNSQARQKQATGLHMQTPNKLTSKRNQKIIDRYNNAILQLLDQSQSTRLKGKIKVILQQMSVQLESDGLVSSSMRGGVGQRAYHELEQKYFESERERQYLRGKMDMSAKRYQGLQRELQRYGKMEKLIDSSIARENELRQEIGRLKGERAFIQAQMEQQKQVFSRQVQAIRQLIDSLKVHLPIN